MDIAAWLAGFALFSLGVFHLSLWYIFRNRFHGFLGLGWILNLSYIVLETKAEKGLLNIFTPFMMSVLLMVFFVMAGAFLRSLSRFRSALLLIAGYIVTALSLMSAWPSRNFLLGTSGGVAFSAIVYLWLANAIARVGNDDFEVLVRGRSPLFSLADTAKGPLVDKFVDNLKEIAQRNAKTGKWTMSICFGLYGLLQLFYPFRFQIKEFAPILWPTLFIIAIVMKLGTAAGAAIVLRASANLVEAKIRRGSLAEELSKITASVEHDMRAPLREMSLIVKSVKQKYQHDSTLMREARELEQLIARIKAVTSLILSIREGSEDYRKRSDKCNLGIIVNKASNSAKTLHSGREVIVKTSIPLYPIHVYGYNERLTQAVTNLINNALEARLERFPDRVAVIEARLKPDKLADKVNIEIEDDGVGIDPKKLPLVKEAYYSTKENGDNPNRGLGLFMADRIIALHGGAIKMTSEAGVGTVATVTLPWPKSLRREK
jgi:signal transduction histidine kinase